MVKGNNNKPLVSIGIPTYNRAHCIGKTIDSILRQNYENIELIVSDNASNDGTEELMEEYVKKDPRIRYVRQEKNLGPYPNFEACRMLAKGRYFMWVASDDELAPNVLNSYVFFLEAHQEYVTVMGKINYWEKGKIKYCEEGLSLEDEDPAKRVQTYYSKVVQGALLYGLHRNAWIRKNPIRTNLAGDWHFIAANAFVGKIKNLDVVGYDKTYEGGISGGSGFPRLVKILGLHVIWGRIPFIRISIETFWVIFKSFSVYKALSSSQRLGLGIRCALSVFFHYYVNFYPLILGARLLRFLRLPTRSEWRERKELKSESI
ncbi:MAG: glycosyltransferase family 2 protein [Bacteroidota bacterium]